MEIIVPEIIIFNTLKNILSFIREDFKANTDSEKTFLFRILGNLNLQRYGYFEQAKQVFVSETDNPRHLDVNMFFNSNRAAIPTLHLMLSSEKKGGDGIGIDQGFRDPEFDDVTETYRHIYNRRFDTQYNIVITSDNSNETMLIYNVLRAILIPIFDHFNQTGIENIRLGGEDIRLDPHLVPPSIFIRSINMMFSYGVSVPQILDIDQIAQLIFTGTINLKEDGK